MTEKIKNETTECINASAEALNTIDNVHNKEWKTYYTALSNANINKARLLLEISIYEDNKQVKILT